MPDLRIHDLRHSVASDAIMQGVPLEVVGKMLGHRNYKTTQRYAHIADTALRDAVNLTSKTIASPCPGWAHPGYRHPDRRRRDAARRQ
jgi:integrase